MKRYVYSATKYKPDDKRLPLIQAIQQVLQLEFTGNKSSMTYSNKYGCYLEYAIFSGPVPNSYKLVVYQSDEPKRKVGETANGYGLITADPDIIDELGNFLESNYSEFYLKKNIHYGFVICKSYFEGNDPSKDAYRIKTAIENLLLENEFIGRYEELNYKAYKDYVSISIPISLLDEDPGKTKDEIETLVKSHGYTIKSISFRKGEARYPAYWKDHRVMLNIFYN